MLENELTRLRSHPMELTLRNAIIAPVQDLGFEVLTQEESTKTELKKQKKKQSKMMMKERAKTPLVEYYSCMYVLSESKNFTSGR
jgi:hypothetical protein